MADSTRPPAPFLPPEIISKILLFLHSKRREDGWIDTETFEGLSLPSRIGRAWKLEAQRRLFEEITIRTSINLLKLAFVLESAPHLGHCVRSLDIIGWTTSNPIVDAHLVFQLISSVPNLTSFSFDSPPFDSFSAADSIAMQLGPPLLPNLIKLNLNTGNDQLWKCAVSDQIVGVAPNIEELKIHLSVYTYVRPMPICIFRKLKKLTLTGEAAAVLIGRAWPLDQFRTLEFLSIKNHSRWTEETIENLLHFFEIVGPNLVELICTNLPAKFHPFLTVLESVNLSYLPLNESSPPKLLLPPTITTLVISRWMGFAKQLDWGQMVKLQEIHFDSMIDFYDLSTLPFLKKLTFESCNNAAVLDSMENLEVGSIRIGELELLEIFDENEDGDIDDFDGADIRTRCEELGIKYTLTIRD